MALSASMSVMGPLGTDCVVSERCTWGIGLFQGYLAGCPAAISPVGKVCGWLCRVWDWRTSEGESDGSMD